MAFWKIKQSAGRGNTLLGHVLSQDAQAAPQAECRIEQALCAVHATGHTSLWLSPPESCPRKGAADDTACWWHMTDDLISLSYLITPAFDVSGIDLLDCSTASNVRSYSANNSCRAASDARICQCHPLHCSFAWQLDIIVPRAELRIPAAL